LERIEGRKTDFIVAPDGRVMHGLSLIYVIREIDGIAAFRITQKRLTEFEVDLVRTRNYDPQSEGRIRDGFRRRLRVPVSVEVRYREAIPPVASGKARYVISEVAPKAGADYEYKAEGANALGTASP
jgi:phenylacetate-CoA ligase